MKYEWKQEKGDGRGPRAQAAGWRPQRDLPGMVRSSALASGVWAAARMGRGGVGWAQNRLVTPYNAPN